MSTNKPTSKGSEWIAPGYSPYWNEITGKAKNAAFFWGHGHQRSAKLSASKANPGLGPGGQIMFV
jgi:hypothetical protein